MYKVNSIFTHMIDNFWTIPSVCLGISRTFLIRLFNIFVDIEFYNGYSTTAVYFFAYYQIPHY